MTSGNYGPPEGGQPPQGPPSFGEQPPPPGYGPPPGPPAGAPPGPPAGAPAGYGQQPPGGFGQYQQYGQPAQQTPGQYGGQQYGAPQPYQMGTVSRQFGIVGTVLAVLGAAACVVSFTALDWFKELGNGKFSDLSDLTGQDGAGATGIATLYFGWLAWVLLAAAVVAAILANLPSGVSSAMRPIGALLGLAGIGATLWAVGIAHGRGWTFFLKRADIGFYVALGGFLLITIGALIGPRRAVTTT
ncbi:MAG: hypothetical protein QOH89_2361 [Pseudonocardiales bacterium]|nr:hypothetical protein [Pseudonocardiales bacterium]